MTVSFTVLKNVSGYARNHGSPKGTRRCVETFWERLQRDRALKHVCNLSNGWARLNRPGSLESHAVELVSASRSEASTRSDAGSMVPRRSVSFPLGNHGYIRNLRCSPSGTRAVSKSFGNEVPTPPDFQNPCLVWMEHS